MEVLQIFDRRTGIWSHRIILTAGYTESFVLDKSTDTAEAKWWEFTDSEIEPPYQDDDWALMMHVENKDDPLTFNDDGTTKNATQYIIKAISKDYDEGNGLWKMNCALEEPIERFKRIAGETLSFTNQTSKYYDDDYVSLTTPEVGLSADNKTVRLTYRGGVYQDRILFSKTGYTAYITIYYYGDTARPQYMIKYGSDSDDVIDGDITGDYIDIDLTPYSLGNITGVENDKESIQFVETYSNPTFYKEPYNYYTALRRWLMVTPANCDTYTDDTYPRSSANKSWYNRIRILDADWLKSIPFADDTWNEMDLYRILFDKYDPLGKTPVIYFDLDKETGLPYTSQELKDSEIGQDLSNKNMVLTLSSYVSGTRTVTFSSGFILTLVVNFLTGNKWTLRDGDGAVIWEHNLTIFAPRKGVKFGDVGTITEISSSGLLNYVNHVQAKPNGRDEYILKFERQDGFDKPVIDFDELIRRKPYERLLSYTVTKDNSTNITGLVCNAENLSSPTVVHYPAQGLFMPPEVNADIRDTTSYNTAGRNDWVLRLPFPIKRIVKLTRMTVKGKRRRYTGGGISVYSYSVGMHFEDRTGQTLERKQYLANPTDLTSSNVAWYEEGGKLIYLKDYKYTTNGEGLYVYSIEYEPLPSARLLIGDTEKTQQINQTSSQIDAESFGRFADSYLKGSNKADITIGKLYAGDYEDFSDLIGSRVKRGDKTYMITQVAYRNIGMDGYNVFMQLNENHMRKNASYRAPQEIRTNTAIATSNLKNRLTAIKQVVKVGFSAAAVADNDSYQFLTDKKILLSALCPTQIDSKYYPQVALFKGKSTLYTDAGLTNVTQFNVTRLATVAKVLSHNQINLITTFVDNAEAGKSKQIDLFMLNEDNQMYGSVKSQIPVLYSDPFGESGEIDLIFGSVSEDGTFYEKPFTEPVPPSDNSDTTEYTKIFNAYSGLGYQPQATQEIQSEIIRNKAAVLDGLVMFKDSLEINNINFVAELQGQNCIICTSTLKLSRLLNQTDAHNIKVLFFDREKGELDDLTTGLIVEKTVTPTTNSAKITLDFVGGVTDMTNKTLVIATATGEKLLIYNNIDSITASAIALNKVEVFFN